MTDGANDDPPVAVVGERLNPGRREVGVRSERERRERKNELQRQRRAARMGLHAVSGEQQAKLAGEVTEAEQLRYPGRAIHIHEEHFSLGLHGPRFSLRAVSSGNAR
ncbi:hypothetical protein GN244_ATG12187 [Phytophthora infestans]|uniref:Uncharacterized protein n=1 Tax=Phytophthora infestans TaxID=4787 RepID=A0A833T8M5_PHYIN|nr:hypothetical protein GN244_ATG12187 [Phytophthora infestans]